jgi:hypothetical protein
VDLFNCHCFTSNAERSARVAPYAQRWKKAMRMPVTTVAWPTEKLDIHLTRSPYRSAHFTSRAPISCRNLASKAVISYLTLASSFASPRSKRSSTSLMTLVRHPSLALLSASLSHGQSIGEGGGPSTLRERRWLASSALFAWGSAAFGFVVGDRVQANRTVDVR